MKTRGSKPGWRWRSRSRRPAIVAGVAIAALLGGAGVAWAASGGGSAGDTPAAASSAAPATAPPGMRGPFRHFRAFPGGPMFGAFGGAVHGQLVVPKPGGQFQTIDLQSGKVTAVSGTSITVRSADGYVHSYAVSAGTIVDAQRDGIGSVKTGHQVTVVATVSGSTASAVSIIDRTLLARDGRGFGMGPWGAGPMGW